VPGRCRAFSGFRKRFVQGHAGSMRRTRPRFIHLSQ
jgi:hypothetical protein